MHAVLVRSVHRSMDLDDDTYEVNAISVGWEDGTEKNTCCVLCEYADDSGGALDYLKKLDVALGGRTDDTILAQMQLESYETLFYGPMKARGLDVPKLTKEALMEHFCCHDINPLRVLRRDLNRMQSIQDTLCPRARDHTGQMKFNGSDARQWAALERMKMDLVRQYEQTDARTSRELPQPPQL
mgnify:CR=1 FL=1